MKLISIIAIILAAIGLIYFSVVNSNDILTSDPADPNSCSDPAFSDLPAGSYECEYWTMNDQVREFTTYPRDCIVWDNFEKTVMVQNPSQFNVYTVRAKSGISPFKTRKYVIPYGTTHGTFTCLTAEDKTARG